MGIFDDAIRQHLDLKRRQGVDEEELKQLEDEAFGLPARPGDPDFPATSETEPSAEVAVVDEPPEAGEPESAEPPVAEPQAEESVPDEPAAAEEPDAEAPD